jgi:hypothetical protein
VSLRDGRRPPFTWVANDAMAVIRRGVPASRQAGVRNAYLATAEAASARGDHEHREGDTIAEIARFACVTERRIREHLQELEFLGLIDIEKRHDVTGRDIAARYEIRDAPRSDDSSGQVGHLDAKTSDPTRARPDVVKEEKEEPSPYPPASGGGQDSSSEATPKNSRVHGTNPRAMAVRAAEHEWSLRARAAVATLTTPNDEHRADFARFHLALQPLVGGASPWLGDLRLGAVDRDALVLDSPQNFGFIGTRFNRVFDQAARQAGIAVRLASPVEHEGFAREAVAQ